jgi:hypothetical protein
MFSVSEINLKEEDIIKNFALPEHRLICSMILRAWGDLSSPNRFIQNDAFYWITDASNPSPKWGFDWCCSHLGLNALEVKKRIMTMPFYKGYPVDRFKNTKKVT